MVGTNLKESIVASPKKVQWISHFVKTEIWPHVILNLDSLILK